MVQLSRRITAASSAAGLSSTDQVRKERKSIEHGITGSFRDRIGVTYRDSVPDWSPDVSPVDTPNVLRILLDDTGFGNLGCYGSKVHIDEK